MATSRPLSYNTGATMSGTFQYIGIDGGSIVIGVNASGYADNYGGLKWFAGPDEDLGYVIAYPVITGRTSGGGVGATSQVAFKRSPAKTENSFVSTVNALFGQNFSTGASSSQWLINNGMWSSWVNSYIYYRWQITQAKTMPPDASCVQASEFRFQLNGVDQTMTPVTVTNPSGSNPPGEEPSKLVDGNLNTKGLDLNFVSNGNVTNFIFQFGDSRSFNGYRWATANDSESRDPKSWNIAGSNDGTNWTTLHSVSNFTATVARNTWQNNDLWKY